MPDPRPCVCGSGLRVLRCCGLDPQLLSPATAYRPLAGLIEAAGQALAAGRAAEAERQLLDLLEIAPGCEAALWLLCQRRRETGPASAVEALLRRIVALNANHLAATHELGLTLLGQGKLGEAELFARNAVRLAPENPQAHNLLGMVLTEANRAPLGEYHYRRVLALAPARDPLLLGNLAGNLKAQGRMDEARALYREAVALAPDLVPCLLGWARLEEADRDLDAAAGLLDRITAVAPGHPGAALLRAVLHTRRNEAASALADLERIAEPDAVILAEKGRLLDRLGDCDAAFAAFAASKRLAAEVSGHAYLDERAADLFARLKGFFTAGRLATLPRATPHDNAPQPIFVLGFPRSGTTLIEQSLSAHPRIAAGDELPMINDIAEAMPRLLGSPLAYPEALAELWMGDQRDGLDRLRDHYLRRAAVFGVKREGVSWFTDKMPLNETHLGLISLMFPDAPLIHLLRHPLDVMLSVFANHLTHGFFCGFALETAARHYARVIDLVAQYRGELTLRYLPVRYEDIIADQEPALRRMLAFIGAEFDPRCLAFHDNPRYARTASYAQVTEKLYDRACGRYRRYLRHLEPVIPILEPVIARLGYTIESAP